MSVQRVETVVIVGVGLIGGSFALAAKRAGRVGRVIGVGRSEENLRRALELGVIDEASQDVAAACSAADLVLVATPVGQMARVFDAIAPVLPAHAIVTDAGSTKGDVVALMRAHLPSHLARCVPAHPIAGSDLSGAAAAQYGLYENRKVVVTPLVETAPDAAELVAELWRACGANVHQMGPDEHDAVFATVSHLPHLLAFAYVGMVADKPDAARCFDFAATGFRDFTRIAGSHPEMWRDISLANRDALLAELARYRANLDALTRLVEAGAADELNDFFEHAREARVAWHQRFLRNS
ncbi:prephenate dehydrogenase/arogenate dehydrogenase family protein [Crenobacter sp. SG2305]|uniref:prephenate dehydrogenase n=1 Tax=Crenobacter oryzisoli TaxID=3056844 RepID=UPI0025AB03B4|nr:prephenate dehydrogenase/arogenate dehydrogenase family protein [Crenobacter sp. SG2305]MDN0081405.1 prephenate dehydrogenase/arogenate dehydrogenase family protein [Crenobacter sp. SG2305]